ncbi:S53 family peptidase [Microbacterium capsulatum]|uniref:S53 family peptidase n=1 Tax=Microbacterium capsulatum TaxID=3041921 RepID=A0ABU0XK66_9MICO|nr:S53 family peptidase [Microbacterium sp. ASV81]MDQ4215212.1 S53 family peptidase [Microbacterium sp. ASV81]
MRKRVLGVSLAVVATVVAALGGTGAAYAAPPPDSPIPNSTPGWLSHGSKVGPASGAVSARVYLAPQGGMDALSALATAVSTPGSAQYRQFLSADQYHAKFDATQSTVDAVTGWLQGAGLKTTVGASHRYIDVTGGVGNANKAFGVTISTYTHDGLTVQAPDGAATTPAALAGTVIAVDGLDTTPSYVDPKTQKPAPPDAGFRNPPICGKTYGSATPQNLPTPDGTLLPKFDGSSLPYSPCGYTGPQLRNAYEAGLTGGFDGKGVTVAITDAYVSPTLEADANRYASDNGDQPFAPGQFSENLPNAFTNVNSTKSGHQCSMPGWYGEQTLDVEAVHAMAPAANIRYYGAKSCLDADLLDTFTQINDENVASIVTNSWGGVGDVVKPALFLAYETAFLQGATQGISYVFSSGDAGDEAAAVGSPQTDYPASDPFVTAVGGTSTAITDAGVTGETGWQTSKYVLKGGAWTLSTSFLYGGGGGYSSNIPEPAYQTAAGISSPNGGRAVPDVSMDGDPTTGMLVGQTQTFTGKAAYDTYRIGGTSLASPLFAGITALKIQANGGTGLGLLNPVIYSTHGKGMHDVTGADIDKGAIRVDYVNGVDATGGYTYSVRTFNGATTTLTVGAGWDTETGWGSPRAGWVQ